MHFATLLLSRYLAARTTTRRVPDGTVYRYATQTYRGGVLIAETPEVTYGQARAAAHDS